MARRSTPVLLLLAVLPSIFLSSGTVDPSVSLDRLTRREPRVVARPVPSASPDGPTTAAGRLLQTGPSSAFADPPLPPRPSPQNSVQVAALNIVRPQVDVRDFGARGDGSSDDTRAIQLANDDVARRGGGRVIFPRGVYATRTVWQDSDVEFYGERGAVLRQTDGEAVTGILMNRTRKTTGTVSAGARSLVVGSLGGIVPGAPLAIRAAGGGSPVQRTTLAAPATEDATVIRLRDGRGFSVNRNLVVLDGEIISYSRMSESTLLGVRRGMFGTNRRAHASGAVVAQERFLYARVSAVVGNVVTLDRAAVASVRGADVYVGTIRPVIRNLTLDGNKPPGGSENTNPIPVTYGLTRWARISNVTFRNGDHGGVMLDRGTTDAVVEDNRFVDVGTPATRLGSAVWIFRGSSGNVVRDNVITGEGFMGVAADDRTSRSTEWDAPSDRNEISGNVIDLPAATANTGIAVEGGSSNVVKANRISATHYGVRVLVGGGGRPLGATANRVERNALSGQRLALYVNGSRNSFVANAIHDAVEAVRDDGWGNVFSPR